MAIIIVAVILTLVAICGYIAYCIRDVRKYEKDFYDLLFLTKFFQEIYKKGKWDTFIRPNSIIYVTRNVIATKGNIDVETIGIDKENVFEIEQYDYSDGFRKEKGYVWYEFKTDYETFSIATKLISEHIKTLNLFKNTMFICSIDKNNVKMTLNGSVEKLMYVSSLESICQNLALILQNKETSFKEKHNWFWDFLGEVFATFNIIAQIKKLLITYDNIISKGNRNT